MKIVFATNNEHKLREVRQILDGKYDVLSLNDIDCHADIPETADTLDGNAMQKARYVHERYGVDVFADDTGLEVDALNGEPGVRTARYAGDAHDTQANVDLLLRNMEGKENRHACFRTAIALIRNGEEHLFEGRVDGEITTRRMGETGFGYDPVFRPEGYEGTFAELGEDVKNGISHRARAVAQLVKFLGMLAIMLLPAGLLAQTVGEWHIHPAYGDAQLAVNDNNTIWCVSSGNLWMLDTESEEITTFDRTTGLSDVGITHIALAPESKRLLVVYESSNIDIIDTETHDVYNISAIKNSDVPFKDINNVCIYHNQAWLATAFGVVVIDMDECMVLNTYKYSTKVNAIAISESTADGNKAAGHSNVFMAMPTGIYTASLEDNLYDQSQIKQLCTNVTTTLRWWNGNLLFFSDEGTATQVDMNGQVKNLGGIRKCTQMAEWGDKMLIVNAAQVAAISPNMSINVLFNATKLAALAGYDENCIYAAAHYEGLVRYSMTDGAMTRDDISYTPNGPLNNNVYRLRYKGQRLMYVCGGCNTDHPIYENGAGWMDNGIWTNVKMEPITYHDMYAGLTDIAEDPNDPNHHFVGSHGHGLLEFRGTELADRYTGANSRLTAAAANPDYYTWVNALVYDPEGRLWISNTHVDTVIVNIDRNGQWSSLYYEDMAWNAYVPDIVIDGNYIWYVSEYHPDLSKIGLMCIDTRGTWGNTADDRARWHNNPIVQQDGQTYRVQHIFAIAPDHDGTIWVGTDMGLFVISSAEYFLQSRDLTYNQIKVNRNDGSGLADYLLSGIWIMDIAVDGANRKWIATNGQGLYLISADGQEELQHFTTDNSPLPSDNITSLAIDNTTGTLMIGTEKGIVSYTSNAILPEEELNEDNIIAYPNPVPPDHTQGITIKGLTNDCEVKITTITGQLIHVTRSNGGMAQWNLCNARGTRVATGVYNVVCTDANGSESVVTRIVVTN